MYATLLVLCLFIVTNALCGIGWGSSSSSSRRSSTGNDGGNNLDGGGGGRQYGKVALILFLWLAPIVSLLHLPRKQEEGQEESKANLLFKKEEDSEDSPISKVSRDSIQNYGSVTTTSVASNQQNEGNNENQPQYDGNDEVMLPPHLRNMNLLPPQVFDSWRLLHKEEEEQGVLPRHNSQLPQRDPQNVVVDFQADKSLPQMLQTPSAWLMLWTTIILVGSGTAKTNNMGQMVEALEFDQATVTPATLAIFSVAQAAGRIMTGILSERALPFDIPRPVFLVIASVVMMLGHVLLATTSTSLVGFVLGCTVSAVAFGMAWPLMVLIVGDIFGVEHHGANYLFFDGVTKALGTIFLSQYVTGTIYEAHVNDSDGKEDEKNAVGDALTCIGEQCFQGTHIVIIGLSVSCILTSLILCRT